MSETPWVQVGPADGFEQGRPRACDVAGTEVFVCREGDRFFCAENACSHAEFPLADGDVEEGVTVCPLHGARFDLDSGAPLSPPADSPIRVFRTRVEDGVLYVALAASD